MDIWCKFLCTSKIEKYVFFESFLETILYLKRLLTYGFEPYICSDVGIMPNGKYVLARKLHYLVSIEEKVLYHYNDGSSPHAIQKTLSKKSSYELSDIF